MGLEQVPMGLRSWRPNAVLPASAAVGCVALAMAGAAWARTLSVNDTAYLSRVHTNGNTGVDSGRSYGSLAGTARVTITENGTHLSFTAVFYAGGGTITESGGGTLHIGGGGYASFKGSAVAKHGTGRYKHVRGTATLYGSENRLNHSATVQTLGRLTY